MPADLPTTRRTLHGLAELVLAGPQYTECADIRLRARDGGIETVAAPSLRLEGTTLVSDNGRHPLDGTFAELAAAAGVEARDLRDVYGDGHEAGPGDLVTVDAEALAVLVDALVLGDAALRTFAPDREPVLWPEHLDVGIDRDEVNYGVSPGDATSTVPYAYVGPWQPRTGPFWNQSFGAARPMTDLPDVDALVAFFAEGAERAASDPPAP